MSLYKFLNTNYSTVNYDLVILGSAIYVSVVRCRDYSSLWHNLDVEKGAVKYISAIEWQARFHYIIEDNDCSLVRVQPGGGLSNTAVIVAALNQSLRVSYLGVVSDDEIGDQYIEKLSERNIVANISKTAGDTGRGVVIIADCEEMTLWIYPGVAQDLSHINSPLPSTKIFATESYLWSNNEAHNNRIKELLKSQHESGALTVFSLQESSLTNQYAKEWREWIRSGDVDVVFGQRNQFNEFFGTFTYDFDHYKNVTFIDTLGRYGGLIYNQHTQKTHYVPAHIIKTRPLDTSSVDDTFLGGALYSLLTSIQQENVDTLLINSLETAACTASTIIQQCGQAPLANFTPSVLHCIGDEHTQAILGNHEQIIDSMK